MKNSMAKVWLAGMLCLLPVACVSSEAPPLELDGRLLHASLTQKLLENANHGVPPGVLNNPHFASDPEVVASITRYATQGQLGGDGIRSAIYAVYQGNRELGFYGLEAASSELADQLERRLREIWSFNVKADLLRIHRSGCHFAVVWHDGVSHECWQAANDHLARQLATR